MATLRRDIDLEVEHTVGYDAAKILFEQIRVKVRNFEEEGGDKRQLDVNLNCRVTGSPGCGKTSFARLFHRFLRAYGLLSKDVFIEANGLELKAEHVGGTTPKVQELVRRAKGGMLFIDGNFLSYPP
jgi:transcriptional regulator with AAA-type ATPase domain